MYDIKVDVINADYQRNGVGGEGFYAVAIRCDGQSLLATIAYKDDGETFDDCSCRVVDPLNLDESFRGDAIGCALIPKLVAYLKAKDAEELGIKETRRVAALSEKCPNCDVPYDADVEDHKDCAQCNRLSHADEEQEKNITATFYQCYDCELDISYDGDDLVSSCFIVRGDYGASLAKAEAEGTLEHHMTGEEIQIPSRVLDTIYKWAEDNGY